MEFNSRDKRFHGRRASSEADEDERCFRAAAAQREFERAANGVIGLETSLALTLALVRAGDLALPRAVERLSSGPARSFGLPYGTLAPGAPADVILVDPERAWKVDPQRFHSRSRNSPFAGWTLRGRVMRTYVEGRLVHRSDE